MEKYSHESIDFICFKFVHGFIEKSGELKVEVVDTNVCISVNNTFVMKAWKADLKIGEEVLLLSNGNGEFTRAIGCELDLSNKPTGLGVGTTRYVTLVKYGVVKILNLRLHGKE
ncbi:hypothetical protein L6452_27184 [Arctium lappa]|uniref:Uncharacterized protein n=1 Tax=Arctium lappa TaxID=4217 RepID=A0ACB8ZV04_ARCLA|nr:hypothetical protein L6452_27184 [Arctium lappa]